MNCQRCNSLRLVEINAKCNDACWVTDTRTGNTGNGYVPDDLGLGEGGDYIEVMYCLDCGQIQGTFPLPPTVLETAQEDEE